MRATVAISAPLLVLCVACSSPSGSSSTTGGSAETGSSSSSSSGGAQSSSAQSGSGGTATSGIPGFSGYPVCTPVPSSSTMGASGNASSGPSWECLGAVCFGPPQSANSAVTLHAIDYLNSANEPGITVKACAEGDDACDHPLATEETDAMGLVTLLVPLPGPNHGFMGHFEMTHPDKIPTIVHLYPPVTGAMAHFTVGVFNQAQLELVSSIAGADNVKPGRGHVGALAQDCALENAAGIQFTLEAEDDLTTRAYLVNNIPSTTATQTDTTGAVGYFNVPPGVTLIHSELVQGHIAVGTVPLLVKEGMVTTLVVPPTP